MPEDADMGHTSNDVLLKDMDKIIAWLISGLVLYLTDISFWSMTTHIYLDLLMLLIPLSIKLKVRNQ
jgi:hypothetical protein